MKKLFTVLLAVFALLLTVNVAFAVGQGSGQTNGQGAGKKVQALKNANAIKGCETITNRIQNRITNFGSQKTQHMESYNKTRDKFQEIIGKLQNDGKDVTKLKADLSEFDKLVTKFGTDYATYIASLTSTKDYTCGKAEGEFRNRLQVARGQLKTVHDDAVALRTFYADTIRPDVLAATAISDTNEATQE